MIAALLSLLLAARIAALEPSAADPLAHARAATASARPGIQAPLLLAIAYHESRFVPHAVSRVELGVRTGGAWPSRAPAGVGPWYCGPMQTAAGWDWALCLSLRDLRASYDDGAIVLGRWLHAARGDLRRALDGYACGWAGLRRGCRGYGAAVLRTARRIGGGA